jgi:hypothetical protein
MAPLARELAVLRADALPVLMAAAERAVADEALRAEEDGAAPVAPPALSPALLQRWLTQRLALYDGRGSGTLTRPALLTALKRVGVEPGMSEARAIRSAFRLRGPTEHDDGHAGARWAPAHAPCWHAHEGPSPRPFSSQKSTTGAWRSS